MASIFTFDPNPPRVSSPWGTPSRATTPITITRLEAEPQEGPTEYKLHLLLRTRRDYRSISTGSNISGSYRSVSASPKIRDNLEAPSDTLSPLHARSIQTRQQRLEQLTTQLLWRLQQSCPVHSTSANNQIAPVFPNASNIQSGNEVGRVIPGLEESAGALYEIGVADDGTLVGLAKDEMDESIKNLRAMAASLGCVVDVLRMVPIGDCEWHELSSANPPTKIRKEKLWVAEAYVKPNLLSGTPHSNAPAEDDNVRSVHIPTQKGDGQADPQSPVQLKVSFTGATMSGKSTILGSLTTATLDNGRGKSRMSLLKHRHEIVSGMTSSVTQELLGYTNERTGTVRVVNYASANVESWLDIHASCTSGRLVLLSDSAGHPRYRRTTVRGLIGWAPDWTLLCIPANTQPAEDILGVATGDVDLSRAHLDLCLKLNLRLVIVVTKYDLASRSGLKHSLGPVFSSIKAAGQTPKILANPTMVGDEADLEDISASLYQECRNVAATLNGDRVVPIVLTSAVNGTGVSTLHALLSNLPIPDQLLSSGKPKAGTLFHIEDTYNTRHGVGQQDGIPVLSGILRHGEISIGDEVMLGPFVTDTINEQSDGESLVHDIRPAIPTSRSFPGVLSEAKRPSHPASVKVEEWHKVKVISLRYLRLPVQILAAGQVGTIGVALAYGTRLTTSVVRVRRGMVLASGTPTAKTGFVAEFVKSDVDGLSIGMGVVVFVASVRASARVVSGAMPENHMSDSTESLSLSNEDEDFAFNFEDEYEAQNASTQSAKVPRLHVTFQFLGSGEYLDVGLQVLVMPGGGPGLYGGQERGEKGVAGLEGFVGTIIDGYT